MKKFSFFWCTTVFILAFQLTAVSQWSTNPAVNNVICNLSGEQAIPKIATCPNGDTYIGYYSNEFGNYNMRLQRLDYLGNILWPADGILISSHPQDTWLTDWDMTCDTSNCAILAFNDIRNGTNWNIVAYRITPDGSFSWGADGIMLSNNTAFNAAPKVTVTASGNAVVAWMSDNAIKLQKINPAGAVQWGAGITLSGTPRYTWPQFLPVGTDDVILKYFEDTGPVNAPTRHVLAQRYTGSGGTVWPSPAVVSNAGGISAWTQIFPFINDGSDGFYIAWHDDRNNDQRASTFVQHVNSGGNVVFTANGVEASGLSSMNHFYPQLALPPGSVDIFVYWNEMNNNQDRWGLYGQKISSSGALQWGNNGKVFIGLSTIDVYPEAARNTPTDMVLFYEQYYTGVNSSIKAMRISTSGDFVWSPSSVTMCSVNSQKVHTVVNEFANNQWIATWEDDRNGNSDIYAQNILLEGNLGPLGSIQGHVTLAGGTANVSLTTVSAGSASTNPDNSGFYNLDLPEGTYSVTAINPYTNSQTIDNVQVQTGQVTPDIDFLLTVNRADLVCKALNVNGDYLNQVNVVINGPEGPYSGTITQDSLVFPHVPYGTFDGTATYYGVQEQGDTIIDSLNHDLIFQFVIEGLNDKNQSYGIQVIPNPTDLDGRIRIDIATSDNLTFFLSDEKGQFVKLIENMKVEPGTHWIPLKEILKDHFLPEGKYLLNMHGNTSSSTCKIIFRKR